MHLIVISLLFCLFSQSAQAFNTQLTIVSEDVPPLQIQKDGKAHSGVMVELVEMMLKEANLTATIEIYPWARSYALALTRPNTLIFSILRGKDRENKFKWIGKLFAIDSFLATLKSNTDIHVNSLDDAKKYTVGAIRDDLAESYLLKHGFIPQQHLYLSSQYPVLWQMLYNGRTDLAFTNSIVWRHEIESAGLNSDDVKLIYKIPNISSELYIAANLDTDDTIIFKLRAALNTIKVDGRYQQLLDKWQLTIKN
jgi:polar amino acid transport system substrate-binding protein